METLLDTQSESHPEPSPTSEEDEELDPRVPIELERLNHAGEAINHLEAQLDEARKTLKDFAALSAAELSEMEKSIGTAVSKARNYYNARIRLRDVTETYTKAKHRFERAQALHVAVKELVFVSADHIDEAKQSNENSAAWDETYKDALAKVKDIELERKQADSDQQYAAKVYYDVHKSVEKLEKDHRRSINKSKPYYEMAAEYHKELDFHKRKMNGLETCVSEAKAEYQQSLRNLDYINTDIHAQRNQGKLQRKSAEQTSNISEEPSNHTELPPSTPSTDGPVIPSQVNHSDSILHSCLLRTESLPVGIFTNTRDDLDLTQVEENTDNLNNQFLLYRRPLPASQSMVVENSETGRERVLSYSSQISQATDDDEDRGSSLHVLSDEQIDYLAYAYQPTDPIDDLVTHLQNSNLQAKAFFQKIFRRSSANN